MMIAVQEYNSNLKKSSGKVKTETKRNETNGTAAARE
jgi:hypothetical protein